MITKNELVAECQKRLAQYPQYDGYYGEDRGWKLALVNKRLIFKGGDIEASEAVLVRSSQWFSELPEKNLPIVEISHLVEAWETIGGHEYPATVHHSIVGKKTADASLVYLE